MRIVPIICLFSPTKLLLVILLICRTVHKEMSPLPVIGVANIFFQFNILSFDIVIGFCSEEILYFYVITFINLYDLVVCVIIRKGISLLQHHFGLFM